MSTEMTEAPFLDFKCPHCGELNSFPQDSTGLVRECFNCMDNLIVPQAGVEFGCKIPLPITTPRQILRRFEARDWEDLLEFMFDSEEEAMRWLEKDRNLKLTTLDERFSLAVEAREGGKLIGCLGLKFLDHEFLQTEIFVTGNPGPMFEGFPNEAIDGLLGFCFDGLKLHRVVACCENTDTARCQLFESVGMRREGEFLKSYRVNGAWLSAVWFAMLDEEYRERFSDRPAESSN